MIDGSFRYIRYPDFILFLFIQKYLVKGLNAGGMKE